MKIDLHTHTEHSLDCRMSIGSLIRKAEILDLYAIAITDHDSMSAIEIARDMARRIKIIPGMEKTCEEGIHLIGLFLKEKIVSKKVLDVIDEIHNQGGLVLLPHPFRPGTGLMFNNEMHHIFTGDEMAGIVAEIDLIEAVNYRCTSEAKLKTDRFLKFCPEIAQIAGSDAHFENEIGKAYVDLESVVSASFDDIKEALLHSPRTLRFEVYGEEAVREVEITDAEKRITSPFGELEKPDAAQIGIVPKTKRTKSKDSQGITPGKGNREKST
jgi:predicted metal-dependent phosphoesterase TrpH